MDCETRIDDLEQALATIAGAAEHGPRDPLQALATIRRVARRALDGASIPPLVDDGGLRRWILYQAIEDFRIDDLGAAVITLGDGHELVLRPVVRAAAGGRSLLLELRRPGGEA